MNTLKLKAVISLSFIGALVSAQSNLPQGTIDGAANPGQSLTPLHYGCS
ncbi:MAG: hypothetical protein JO307_04795 [Bryobacterales bacterium]|nr:hypothetical protein [Bryobacterales bacterium]